MDGLTDGQHTKGHQVGSELSPSSIGGAGLVPGYPQQPQRQQHRVHQHMMNGQSSSNGHHRRPCSSPLGFLALLVVGITLNIFCFPIFFALLQARNQHVLRSEKESALSMSLASLAPNYQEQRLVVVVPAHGGDLSRALASLARWPTSCSHVTLHHAELMLYYALGPDDSSWSEDVIPALAKGGGRCFAKTSVMFANLTVEENVYPKGASVQFYKMFLDSTLRRQLQHFGAIAIVEWDVVVAHDSSFERLYHAAFGAVEPFWVKGSSLAGTNFHNTVALADNWHMLGHINGNALYNNTDPDFVEFINFTLQRWDYLYSYDVALWATIADFPYSWPLWQRFSKYFVTTDLISNVGFLEVDQATIPSAVERNTMFIHGSLSGGGGTQFLGSGKRKRQEQADPFKQTLDADQQQQQCKATCGTPQANLISSGTSTVCDHSCADAGSSGRFGGLMCGAGNPEKLGNHCRLCYVDEREARKVDRMLVSQNLRHGSDSGRRGGDQHVIMCDTMRPPEAEQCDVKCAAKKDTICDDRCGAGHFDDYNCNWRDYGNSCRFCFEDHEAAIAADKTAKRNGGRVIMCNTHEPPVPRDVVNVLTPEAMEDIAIDAFAIVDGVQRVEELDASEDSHDAKSELFEDAEKGRAASGDTGVDYSGYRGEEGMTDPAMVPYMKDIRMGELCAVLTGYFVYLAETVESVKSVVHFMPGMRVVVTTDPVYFYVFERALRPFPEVTVISSTTAAGHTALMADKYCGPTTKLVYYLGAGEVISRTFTQKDTHSTRGNLLVPFTELERLDDYHTRRARATTSLLGFDAPSFSYGADLLLPPSLNRRLRRVLCNSANDRVPQLSLTEDEEANVAFSVLQDIEDAFVPEMLAGLAYSRNPRGIWFLNPQQWVIHHMFKRASVWDIPLVKPRYGCQTDLGLAIQGYDVARELGVFVNTRGGVKCESGYYPLDASRLNAKPGVEFGAAVGNPPVPSVQSLSISVVYMVGAADPPWMLNATLPSVIENFPGALEVVVVVKDAAARRTFGRVLKYHERRREGNGGLQDSPVPFPMRVVMEERLTEEEQAEDEAGGDVSGRKRRFPLLWADRYCSGRHILHLTVDAVIMGEVTYDRMFHKLKPVVPFTRFRDGGNAGQTCWRKKASRAMLSDGDVGAAEAHESAQAPLVLHEFSLHDNHIYPVSLYPALRSHLASSHEEASLFEVMSTGVCDGPPNSVTGSEKRDFRRIMQFSLMATFMWYKMHDVSVHWRALDPIDLQPDDWLVDPELFDWICNLGFRQHTLMANRIEQLPEEIQKIDSMEACYGMRARLQT